MTRRLPHAATLLAAGLLCQPAEAALMTATVTGTISPSGGFDAYGNTLGVGTNLANLAASVSITYDSDLMVDLYPGSPIYHTTTHSPGYPSFNGTVGQNPIRSASFTVNGITLNLDVSGPSERGNLQVEDFSPATDTYNLTGGDQRLNWCPNDFQCVESVGINAYSPGANLFDANGYQPTDLYTWTASNLTSLTASVRLYDAQNCQTAALGGFGGATGLCPDGRFSYANSATPHWIEFQVAGSQLTIAPASPVPLPAAGWMLVSGLGVLAGSRRRTAKG